MHNIAQYIVFGFLKNPFIYAVFYDILIHKFAYKNKKQ